MKIFIICYLLFIHVNMCIFIHGFWVSIWVSGIHLGFGYPRVWFWWWISTRIGVRFGFGFQLWVLVLGAQRLHSIRTWLVSILRPHLSSFRGLLQCGVFWCRLEPSGVVSIAVKFSSICCFDPSFWFSGITLLKIQIHQNSWKLSV
jgi:hypothetical protein